MHAVAHSPERPRTARLPADARLAAAAASRAAQLEDLRQRAARASARALHVAARERVRRAADRAARAERLAARMEVASARVSAARARRAADRAARAARFRCRVDAADARRRAISTRGPRRGGRAARRAARAGQACRKVKTRTVHASTSVTSPTVIQNARREAARAIAGAFLLRRGRDALAAAGLSADAVARLPFDALSSAVSQPAALDAASVLLRSAGREHAGCAPRELLAALVTSLHPTVCGDDAAVSSLARSLTAFIFFGRPLQLAAATRAWAPTLAAWRARDRVHLAQSLAADLAETEAAAASSGGAYARPLAAHRARILRAAKAAGLTSAVAAASARARRRKDDALAHAILLDLPGVLARAGDPRLPPSETWESVAAEAAAGSPGPATSSVVSRLQAALDAMAPGAFAPPSADSDAFAPTLLDASCAALRASHAPADDAPLARWQDASARRLAEEGTGAMADVLRELTERVLATAAAVRVLRIRAATPTVEQFGAARERDAFAAAVEAGEVDAHLPATRAAIVACAQSAASLVNGSHGLPRTQVALRAVLAHVLTTEPAPPLPEILHLDARAISRLRTRARAACILSALHAALRALGVASPDIDSLRSAGHGEHSSLEEAAAAQIPSPVPANAQALLRRSMEEPVRLLARRVQRVVETGDVPAALKCVEEDVGEIGECARRIADLATRVHGERVQAIIEETA